MSDLLPEVSVQITESDIHDASVIAEWNDIEPYIKPFVITFTGNEPQVTQDVANSLAERLKTGLGLFSLAAHNDALAQQEKFLSAILVIALSKRSRGETI